MPVEANLHADVRDLLFADWAEVVTFVEVASVYDPANGETTETTSETDLLAIPGPGLDEAVQETAHQLTSLRRCYLIRAEDLPPDASFATSRIRHQETLYALLTADHAPVTNVIAFQAVALE